MKRAFDLNDCLGGELIEVKAARMAEPDVEEEVVEEEVEAEAEEAVETEAAEEEAGCATPNPNDVLPPQFASLVALIGAETQSGTEADELKEGGATPDPNDVLPPEYGALAALINEEAGPKVSDVAPRRWGGGGASPGLLREDGGVFGYMRARRW